jgi:uncharacterized SAM-binding protein YcdF (DUF218 family)
MNVIAESMSRESAAKELAMVSKPRRSRWGRRLLIFAALCIALFVFRHPLMSLAARWWIISDPVDKADAVVVLGGGLDQRPFIAAELFTTGKVPLVLVAEPALGPATKMNLTPADIDVTVGILEKQGVPGSAIQHFGNSVRSTRDEAAGLHEWLKSHPVKRVVIPTEPFHTRRVKWIFSRELKDTGVELAVVAIPNPRYNAERWWENEESMMSFFSEMVKSFYYHMHY